jgi:Putative Flp pilus-assembly TadE/G-like
MKNTIRKQKGQSLLWVLGFMATMAATFAGVYSVGQTTSEKQKIVNAADAAAYTGAMVEARALNLTAYANRAEIANEVFIAQMVSMESWVAYFKQTINSFKSIANKLKYIPYIGIVFQIIEGILQTIESMLNAAQTPLNKAVDLSILGVDKVYYTAYKAATTILYSPLMVVAAQQSADNVLKANAATHDGKIDTAPVAFKTALLGADNAFEWNRGFKLYSKDGKDLGSATDGRRNAGEILKTSRDQFSTERKGSEIPIFDLLWGTNSMGIRCAFEVGSSKNGPTDLKTYDRWEAQDTSQYGMSIGSCKGTSFGIPYGWGRSTAADNQTKGDRKTNPHRLAGLRAYNETKQHGNWSGVKELWDIKRDSSDYLDASFEQDKEKLSFTVAVAKQKVDIKNNENLNFMNRETTSKLGSPDLKADFADGQISAKSSAKIFFSRPVKNNADITGTSLFRVDNHKEVSNLYNPYWQVRLTDLSLAAKEIVYAGKNPALPLLVQ